VQTQLLARRQHILGVSAARATDQVQREVSTLPYISPLRAKKNVANT